MLREDYNALQAMLKEFRQELCRVREGVERAHRRIREADALVLALTKGEPEDMRVFSPRKTKDLDHDRIEAACREKEALEADCRDLGKKENILRRYCSTLETVLSRQVVEEGREATAGPENIFRAEQDCARAGKPSGILGASEEAERQEPEFPAGREKLDTLTEREREILCQVAEGMLNKEIAAALDISEQTVKNHVSNIFQKLGVADRTQAAVFSIKNGLVD